MEDPEFTKQEEESEALAAREKARKAAALSKGRQSTILTGSLGDTSEATVIKKHSWGSDMGDNIIKVVRRKVKHMEVDREPYMNSWREVAKWVALWRERQLGGGGFKP